MVVEKKLSIVMMDPERISDVNDVIFKYSVSASKSSSHLIFNVEPVNLEDLVEDLAFFNIRAENEKEMDEKLNMLIEELNQLDTDYSIRNMETNDFYTTVSSVGAIYIKLDGLDCVPKGTYEKIDELKNAKNEFGYCKGYRPAFRPIEGIVIENLEIKSENIYLFSKTPEDMPKLIDHMSELAMEINPEFEVESKIFK